MRFYKLAVFFPLLILSLLSWPAAAAKDDYNSHYVFLPKAEVIGLDEGSIQVLNDDLLYTVKLGGVFGIYSRWWSQLSSQELATGNVLQIFGRQVNGEMIEAKLVRNVSLQKRLMALLGVVVKVSESDKTIYLESKMHGLVEVIMSPETLIIDPKKTTNLKDIKPGQRLVAKGLWDKANNRLTEVAKIVVFRLGEEY
ncbi:MAG: hypothetical protein ACOZAJ_01875 [Patescibacteria group bacterium]